MFSTDCKACHFSFFSIRFSSCQSSGRFGPLTLIVELGRVIGVFFYICPSVFSTLLLKPFEFKQHLMIAMLDNGRVTQVTCLDVERSLFNTCLVFHMVFF